MLRVPARPWLHAITLAYFNGDIAGGPSDSRRLQASESRAAACSEFQHGLGYMREYWHAPLRTVSTETSQAGAPDSRRLQASESRVQVGTCKAAQPPRPRWRPHGPTRRPQPAQNFGARSIPAFAAGSADSAAPHHPRLATPPAVAGCRGPGSGLRRGEAGRLGQPRLEPGLRSDEKRLGFDSTAATFTSFKFPLRGPTAGAEGGRKRERERERERELVRGREGGREGGRTQS